MTIEHFPSADYRRWAEEFFTTFHALRTVNTRSHLFIDANTTAIVAALIVVAGRIDAVAQRD